MGHHGRVGGERLCGVEVVPEADERLADPVVDLARQVAALDLLGFDGPGGELLQHRFPFREPFVEPGVLDRPGQKIPDLAQQRDVVVAVAAGLLRVDVEHADHLLSTAEQRDRHQRLVLLAPQLGDVPVPLVLPLVGHHGRFGVERHPARHAFSEGQLDGPRQARERWRRPHENEHLPGVVEHVNEAHVGFGGLDDEDRHLLGHVPQVQVGRGDLDDPAQQPVLVEDVGPEGPRLGFATNGRFPRGVPRRWPGNDR